MLVRDFHPNDYESLIALWVETGMGGPERGDDLEVIQRSVNSGGRLFILEDEYRNLIGSSWMTHDSRRMFLHHFAISKAHQGKGLSHLLLKPSMQWMRKKGLQIKLEVHRSNTIAVALYEKYGFQKLGDYQVLIIRDVKKQ